ncbi:hypothetical protein RPAAT24_0157 [Rickettsia parkeri str. AT|nr:hypothetical protein RPAAT24_0157 [Rickettsia parkeri str. AT\
MFFNVLLRGSMSFPRKRESRKNNLNTGTKLHTINKIKI